MHEIQEGNDQEEGTTICHSSRTGHAEVAYAEVTNGLSNHAVFTVTAGKAVLKDDTEAEQHGTNEAVNCDNKEGPTLRLCQSRSRQQTIPSSLSEHIAATAFNRVWVGNAQSAISERRNVSADSIEGQKVNLRRNVNYDRRN